MCQDIQQATFLCGHQAKYWYAKSRFCLFKGEGASRFHTVYFNFERFETKCPRCIIVDKIKQEGKVMKRPEFKQTIEDRYAITADAQQERMARKWEALAQEARSGLTAQRIADLELQIKETVAQYLARSNCTPASKVVLLRTLTKLPDMFNIQELVRFFASRYFSVEDKKRKLLEWERKKLFSIAHHARLDRTFKSGLNLEPLPLPTRQEKAETASQACETESSQKVVEEGLENLVLS